MSALRSPSSYAAHVHRLLAATTMVWCVLPVSDAQAQYRGPVSRSAPLFELDTPTSFANTPFTPKVENSVEAWGTLVRKLNEKGIGIVVDYTSESAIALDTAHAGDAAYAHQIGAELDLDWGRLVGWQGLRTHAVFVNRAGHNLAADLGDHSLNGYQEIFGSGGDVGVKLVYVYATQNLLRNHMQIAMGKMPVNIDFANSPLYCVFMNKSNCGVPKSLTRNDAGFATYPGSVWGGRVRYWPDSGVYAQTGVYGVNPDLNTNRYDRSGFRMGTSLYTGVYVPVEFGWIPSFGKNHLVGHYKFGVAYDSSNYPDLYFDTDMNSAVQSGKPHRQTNGKTQLWLEADQMIVRHGDGPLHGTYILAGMTRGQENNSPYGFQVFAGLVDRGFFKRRPKDTIGVEWSETFASSSLIAAQWERYRKGDPLPGNATYPQSHLMTLEATYAFQLYKGVSVQPDYQHIWRTNLQRNKPQVDVIGLRLHAVL
ncbi:carbohydrate porin [Swaminathania salitolerans]|nr:carbohydrate porin [Swaminathania salitolerans]